MGSVRNPLAMILALAPVIIGASWLGSEVALNQSHSSPKVAMPQPMPPTPTATILASRPIALTSDQSEPWAQQYVDTYLARLEQRGFSQAGQGIWLQTQDQVLAQHQGSIPLPAASVTKVATTLAALETYGPDYRFVTTFSTTGTLEKGVLQGDLIVQGAGDPFFVWEDAIAIGNLLHQAGIQQISGQILISGPFYMNFKTDIQAAGDLLKVGLNANLWTPEAKTQYQTLPSGTLQPQVAVQGGVQVVSEPPLGQLLIQHQSFPVAELLKKMNRYSNNVMADIMAQHVGGATKVAEIAANTIGVPSHEIQLINGSGLGVGNQISPRAATAMMVALDQLLDPHTLSVGDLFEIVGVDDGVLKNRNLPRPLVAKSGTLNQVSSLVGALSTQDQPVIWFVIMNTGYGVEGFRTSQGVFLQGLVDQWSQISQLPTTLAPNPTRSDQAALSQLVTRSP